jgi:hypothetical protein
MNGVEKASLSRIDQPIYRFIISREFIALNNKTVMNDELAKTWNKDVTILRHLPVFPKRN